MLEHVVLLKLKSALTFEEKQKLDCHFQALKNHIEGLLHINLHENVYLLEDSFELGLFIELADDASLKRYRESPERQAVSQYARSLCHQVVLFDYCKEQPMTGKNCGLVTLNPENKSEI